MNDDTKQKIIELNNKFGIKTEFITDENILGYSLGKTIYINESIEQDYERTNKHELLHFFENEESFKKLKERLLEENKEKIDEIRSKYELRYFGLYSDEEIKNGVLDNEIAIDIMVNNLSFEYEDGLKIGKEYLGEVQKEIEERRYLNVSLTSNIKNMNLSKWEKIFVLNYYDGKNNKLPQKDRISGIKSDIESYLKELCELDREKMRIDPTCPEVIRKYESEIKALKFRGEDTHYLERNKEESCNEIASKISNQLYEEYTHIVDLISGLEYEPAFKCLMLRETLTKTYKLDRDKETQGQKTIVKNRDLNKSIAGHMILNISTLDIIYRNIENIEEYQNFANLYFVAVEIYKKTITEKSKINLDGVDTLDKGKWLKFDGKNTDEERYIENAKKLSALVQNTPWCTKTLASAQLAEGDFYVFVDSEEKPHIAVKTIGNKIDEVRGIQNGSAQEIEKEYRDVAISFLENNRNIENGKEWLDKEEWNKRLIEYNKKIENGEITVEDIPSLMEDYLRTEYRSQRTKENSNKVALRNNLKKIKGVLAEYYKCSEEEISVEDVNYFEKSDKVIPYKVIIGNLILTCAKNIDLGNLHTITGDADFCSSENINLGELQYICGHANFTDSNIDSLRKLKTIGKSGMFIGAEIKDLGELESIGEDAYFGCAKIKRLGKLKTIGGGANFMDSEIVSLDKLETIGGYANFNTTKLRDLGELRSIGAGKYFKSEKLANEYSRREEAILNGQDIGKAGFGLSVDVYDRAKNFILQKLNLIKSKLEDKNK